MYKKYNEMILTEDGKLEEFKELNSEESVYYYTKEAVKNIRHHWKNTLLKRQCFDIGALFMNQLMMHSGNIYRNLKDSYYVELRYLYPQLDNIATNVIKPLKDNVKSNNILQLARNKNIYKFREVENSFVIDCNYGTYIEETISNGFVEDFEDFIEIIEDSIEAEENAPIAGFLDEFSIATAKVLKSVIAKIDAWYPNLNGIL